jgi:nucleoside-diphosphate-sugar epimerase
VREGQLGESNENPSFNQLPREAWNLRVLVTGGAGFLGPHIAEFCDEKDDEVTVVDNYRDLRISRVTPLNVRRVLVEALR